MERNNLDPFDQHLRHKLSGSAPTEVHQRTQQHFESLAAEMKRREAGLATSEHEGRGLFFILARTMWRELIWPSRRIWAGLAVAWLVILGLNVASSEPTPRVASRAEARSGKELRALIEQRRMLAQMTDPLPEPANTRKSNPPGPRSDRAAAISAA
jgi:hypothetical protein